jgi:hypothetical protein
MACAVSACGGGSGGGTVPVRPFTSWSAVQPSTAVKAAGISQSGSANYTLLPNGDLRITSINSISPVDASSSSTTLTFDANRNLTAIDITTPSSSVSFSNTTLGGTSVSCSGPICVGVNASGTSAAVLYNPYDPGVAWEYQSFGVWATGSTTAGTIGTMSYGAPTPVNAIPTTGSAIYNGFATGYYVDSTGLLYGSAASMQANVTFGNLTSSIAFSTNGTVINNTTTGTTQRPDLNLAGIWNYTAGAAQFAGAVSNAAGLSGTATGRFYGPAAEEIGGIYVLRNGLLESMLGGFGGKR